MEIQYEGSSFEEESCSLCEGSERAKEDIPAEKAYSCCNCGAAVACWVSPASLEVIGDNNGCGADQKFRKRAIVQCGECDQYMRLELQPLIWNASHDVFYTGEKSYIPLRSVADLDIEQLFTKKAEPSVEQWLRRRAEGENLKTWNLCLWIVSDLEKVIVELINATVAAYKPEK